MNGWLSVEEAARICGTDVQRITLWMNGNHIAFARFDTVLMIDGTSLFALFERNRVDTIYDDVQQKKKRGRPGKHSELLNTPLDRLGFSQRVVKACRELSIFTTEHLLIGIAFPGCTVSAISAVSPALKFSVGCTATNS